MPSQIDVTFDFRSDTPPGKDPDQYSPALRRCHKLLWSKSLPGGLQFALADTAPGIYLHHKSEVGEFYLASDTVIPTFSRWKRLNHIISQVPPHSLDCFKTLCYSIGGMMVFPGQRVQGKMTINGARGWDNRICDRFDLTVECIRRYYCKEKSPLSETLDRYGDFLDLFRDFRGYIEFFLLQDIVHDGTWEVKFFMPFDDFRSSPLPSNQAEYGSYMQHAVEFIKARNKRIQDFCG